MEDERDLNEDNQQNTTSDDENKSAISADLIRGHINTIILRTLYERDKYGYEIIEEIEKKSHGQYSLKQPTLYSALKRLETQGYINAYWKTDEVSLGGRRKYYTLTDSGREISERNQAEWEYSRTVIDNLISDRSFDFSRPAPASVDFKILKKSTSRVPVVKDEDEDDDFEEETEEVKENKKEEKAEAKTPVIPEVEIKNETVTFTTDKVIYYESQTDILPDKNTASTPPPVQEAPAEQAVPEPAPVTRPSNEHTEMTEEQRRVVHENYLRLISEPVKTKEKEVDVVPVADDIDTQKLIYNNKPKTERDYKNLINGLFDKTVNRQAPPHSSETRVKAEANSSDDLTAKAEQDGLKINTSDFVVSTRKKSYNRGATLLKCSLIITVILLLEFTVSILFKKELGVGLGYPFVILAMAVAQLLIFGIIYYTDLGKSTRKPSSAMYLTACIIITVILILIIFLISLLLQVNFTSAGDIFAKIIIPCVIALNIPIFAGCFYALSK